MKKVKGLSKNNKKTSYMDSSMVMTRGKEGGGRWERSGGINGEGRRLDLEW